MEINRDSYCITLSKNLNLLMKKYGKKRKQVSKDLGVPYTTYTDWVNGNAYPRLESMQMIADYFHLGVDDLQIDITENSDVMRRINAYIKLLDEANGEIVPSIRHKTLSERISEYNGEVNFYEYKWEGLIDEKLFCE